MSIAQKFSKAIGWVYVAVGLVGFVGVIGGTVNQDPSQLLGIFGITALHNVVHAAVGAAFIIGSSSDANARNTCTVIGAVYLLLGIVGFFQIGLLNDLFNLNVADHLLHLASGVAALYFGLAGRAPSPA